MKQYILFGYLFNIGFAKTVWVTTKEDEREWHIIKFSRHYQRPTKYYLYDIVIGKFKMMWAKI